MKTKKPLSNVATDTCVNLLAAGGWTLKETKKYGHTETLVVFTDGRYFQSFVGASYTKAVKSATQFLLMGGHKAFGSAALKEEGTLVDCDV